MLGYANWYSTGITREILFFVPFMQVLLIGPVVYFYTKSLLNDSFKLSKKDWIHFVPSILYLIYSLIVFITDKLILDEFYFYADGRDKDLKTWYQLLGLASISYYLILSLKRYLSYKKLIFDIVSYADSILFRWIQNFLLAFLTLIIIRVIFFFSNPQWIEFGSQFWYYILFSLIIFYISVNGYANAVKISVYNGKNSKTIDVFSKVDEEQKTTQENPLEKDLEKWKEKILTLILEEKVYENPRLTLSEVAETLETTTKNISSTINVGFQMNFNDFINHYRIEAVKEKMNSGEHHTTTLLGIAFDCGFNSKATFNRAFKKSILLSPKDYLDKIS